MALNFDKFLQLRENYAKPKFAVKECQRRLQKQPNDPYLQAWKAEITANTDSAPVEQFEAQCQALIKRSPAITDLKLLEFLYGLMVDFRRQSNPHPLTVVSAGPEAQQLFSNAAKAAKSAKERAKLFSGVFASAVEVDCWEDARWALLNYRKDSAKNKKAVFFDLILAYQLSFEKLSGVGEIAPAVKLQRELAYKSLLQAFKNTSEAPEKEERISDVRDIRFLAQILRRQGRGKELLQILDSTPAIQEILVANSPDFLQLKLDVLEEESLWDELWQVCYSKLQQAIEESKGLKRHLTSPLLQNWKLYSRLILASTHLQDNEEVKEKSYELRKQLSGLPDAPREALLFQVSFSAALQKDALLSACVTYWQQSHQLRCCFNDLRKSVEQLKHEEQKEFLVTISSFAKGLKPTSETTKAVDKWFMAEINVLKLEYLLSISHPKVPDESTVEKFAAKSIHMYNIGSRMKLDTAYEAGCLAVSSLGFLHHLRAVPRVPDGKETTEENGLSNGYILTQAAFLVQHLTSGDAGKQNRPVLLLAVRVLLFCGLGSLALQLYPNAKVKEMLQETCSHVLLTNISQTHPFNSAGTAANRPTSPDDELASVVGSLERMTRRTNDFLSNDIDSFHFDQTFEMRAFKADLRSSLTKHLCALEQRRLIRLRNGQVDRSELFDLQDFDGLPLSDKRDFSILPSYESTSNRPVDAYFTVGPYPDAAWYWERMNLQDHIYTLLFKEPEVRGVAARIASQWNPGSPQTTKHPIDQHFLPSWLLLRTITDDICGTTSRKPGVLENEISTLGTEIEKIKQTLEMVSKEIDPEFLAHARILPGEALLSFLYGALELLRAVYKMCETVRAAQNQKAAHRLKKEVEKQKLEGLLKLIESVYKLVQQEGQSRMNKLKGVGVRALSAQAEYGATGEMLRELLREEMVSGYAEALVLSGIEALSAIGRVKLK